MKVSESRMKSGKVIGLAMPALVLIAVCAFHLFRPAPEPQFDGKPLSFWMMQLHSNTPRRNPEAIAALRAMGEPAVRQLTKVVEREDSYLTKQLLRHADKFPALQNTISSKFWYRYYAAYALGVIGTNAASAIPALKKMAGDSEKSLAWVAGAALVLVQGEALERYISDCLNYTNNIRVSYAFGVLCNLGPYAEAAIPSLVAEIESTNNRVRSRVIHVLGTVGAESQTCVQVMIHLLGDEDSLVRSMAADALANYGPMAKRATPFVAKLLDDNEDLCRTSALMFFYRIVESNELEPYRTAVQRMTNDSSQTVRDFAGLVLDGKKP